MIRLAGQLGDVVGDSSVTVRRRGRRVRMLRDSRNANVTSVSSHAPTVTNIGASTGGGSFRSPADRSSQEGRGSRGIQRATSDVFVATSRTSMRWPCAMSRRLCVPSTHAATWRPPVMLGAAAEQVFDGLTAAFAEANGT